MAVPSKYQAKEVLNKVLNAGENALQVDIISGAEYAEDSQHTDLDTGNFVLGVRNDTLAALGGTDGDYVPFQMNASGALYVEIATGGGEDAVYVDDADWTNSSSKHMLVGGLYQSSPQSITDGDTGPLQVNANGNLIVDLSATDNAVLDAMVVDLAAIEALIITLDGVQDSALTKLGEIETTNNANQVLLGTIDSDTDATKTATEASQSALEKMLYGNALVITAVDGGSTQALGATYESLYVGVGGNVVVTMVGTGNFTFSNVASGQLLPIRITHVINTNTTATNMIALKA